MIKVIFTNNISLNFWWHPSYWRSLGCSFLFNDCQYTSWRAIELSYFDFTHPSPIQSRVVILENELMSNLPLAERVVKTLREQKLILSLNKIFVCLSICLPACHYHLSLSLSLSLSLTCQHFIKFFYKYFLSMLFWTSTGSYFLWYSKSPEKPVDYYKVVLQNDKWWVRI